jgi:hypothetical protein
MRDAIIEHAGGEIAPLVTVRRLSPRERKLLKEGDIDEVLAGRRSEFLTYSLAFLNAAPSQLDKYSYGFQLQQKELERLSKLAFPEKLRIEHSGEIRRLPDAQLVLLLDRLGLAVPQLKALPA